MASVAVNTRPPEQLADVTVKELVTFTPWYVTVSAPDGDPQIVTVAVSCCAVTLPEPGLTVTVGGGG
jgi:hypothetical protein